MWYKTLHQTCRKEAHGLPHPGHSCCRSQQRPRHFEGNKLRAHLFRKHFPNISKIPGRLFQHFYPEVSVFPVTLPPSIWWRSERRFSQSLYSLTMADNNAHLILIACMLAQDTAAHFLLGKNPPLPGFPPESITKYLPHRVCVYTSRAESWARQRAGQHHHHAIQCEANRQSTSLFLLPWHL